jgi:glucosamine-6-phosphate deaminase
MSAARTDSTPQPVREFQTGGLLVRIYRDRGELGSAAAAHIAERIAASLRETNPVGIIFASAPSQTETLRGLVESGVKWEDVVGFHLDEYSGARATDAHSFRKFLVDHFLSKVQLREFHEIHGEAANLDEECLTYAALLREISPRLALLGIGENGHLAFNDPGVADFEDPLAVKVAELDEMCRAQQVNDGAFARLEDVPNLGLTLTVPEIMRVPELFAMVPGPRKRYAVRDTLEGPLTALCPASILRTHASARLFLDLDSAALLG